jgi:hypothetical protein
MSLVFKDTRDVTPKIYLGRYWDETIIVTLTRYGKNHFSNMPIPTLSHQLKIKIFDKFWREIREVFTRTIS